MYLSPQQIKRYKIMSRKQCEKYCTQKHNKTSMVISIKSTWDREMPDVYGSEKNNVKYILRLSFDDIEQNDSKDAEKFCMKYEDGKYVANFVNEHYKDVDLIIVHCDGGISRSSGVAAGIMRAKEGDDHPIFGSRVKKPNMTCYLRTLKGFGYI